MSMTGEVVELSPRPGVSAHRFLLIVFLLVGITGLWVVISGAGQPDLTIHLETTSTKVEAGRRLHAVLVFTNRTDDPITIADDCGAWITLALRPRGGGPGTASGVAFPSMCSRWSTITPGRTKRPYALETRYPVCAPRDVPSENTAACVGPRSRLRPPLPPGEYVVEVIPRGFVPPLPEPLPVRIVAALG